MKIIVNFKNDMKRALLRLCYPLNNKPINFQKKFNN